VPLSVWRLQEDELTQVGRLYAATGDAIARLDEAGEGWAVKLVLSGSSAQCLAVDTGRPGHRLRRSARGRCAPQRRRRSTLDRLQAARAGSVLACVSGADGAVYAGNEPSRLFRSDDRGESWRELTRCSSCLRGELELPAAPWTSHVRWIAPNPTTPGLLLVGIELGGLMRSTTAGRAGRTTVRRASGRPLTRLAPHIAGARTKRAAAAPPSVRTQARPGSPRRRPRPPLHMVGHRRPDDPDCWYVSASTGPYAAHGRRDPQARIYRRRGANPGSRSQAAYPSHYRRCPTHSCCRRPPVRGLADGQLWESGDRGDHWTASNSPGTGSSPSSPLGHARAKESNRLRARLHAPARARTRRRYTHVSRRCIWRRIPQVESACLQARFSTSQSAENGSIRLEVPSSNLGAPIRKAD